MKNLLMVYSGIRSAEKTLVDDQVHTLYFKTKTPAEVAAFSGAERRMSTDEAGDQARENLRATFIAQSMCNQDGSLMFTLEEAKLIPATLKPELCQMILVGSNIPGESGKLSPPREKSGTGTS